MRARFVGPGPKEMKMAKDPVISIIDDDLSVRVALESLVRSLGYVARTYESAEAFLGSSSVTESACIVADVQMPGMSGLDLHSRLKKAGHTMPLILITAFPEDDVRGRAETGGAFGFLAKPFDGQALVELISSALQH
jgi:FixJ family two-component response regulator